jgi:hypothetical protein
MPLVASKKAESAKTEPKNQGSGQSEDADSGAALRKNTEDLFIHLGGSAYDCPDKKPGHVILRVKEFKGTNTADKTVVTSWPSTKPSDAENGGAEGSYGTFKGLWVGMQPSNANEYRLKAGDGFPRGKFAPTQGDGRQRKSIEQVIQSGKMRQIAHDPKALRVVVNIDSLDSRVYVLANPDKNGLCLALPTQTELVWYAREYRDDKEPRNEYARKACNARIKAQLDRIKNRTLESNARPNAYQEILPQHPTVTAMIELRRVYDKFRLTEDEASLKKALSSVESLSKDLRARRQCQDRHIIDRLLDASNPFGPDDEKTANQAIKVHLSRSHTMKCGLTSAGPVQW